MVCIVKAPVLWCVRPAKSQISLSIPKNKLQPLLSTKPSLGSSLSTLIYLWLLSNWVGTWTYLNFQQSERREGTFFHNMTHIMVVKNRRWKLISTISSERSQCIMSEKQNVLSVQARWQSVSSTFYQSNMYDIDVALVQRCDSNKYLHVQHMFCRKIRKIIKNSFSLPMKK